MKGCYNNYALWIAKIHQNTTSGLMSCFFYVLFRLTGRLAVIIVTVKPFAKIVGCYLCQNRDNEFCYELQGIHLPPSWYLGDSFLIIARACGFGYTIGAVYFAFDVIIGKQVREYPIFFLFQPSFELGGIFSKRKGGLPLEMNFGNFVRNLPFDFKNFLEKTWKKISKEEYTLLNYFICILS